MDESPVKKKKTDDTFNHDRGSGKSMENTSSFLVNSRRQVRPCRYHSKLKAAFLSKTEELASAEVPIKCLQTENLKDADHQSATCSRVIVTDSDHAFSMFTENEPEENVEILADTEHIEMLSVNKDLPWDDHGSHEHKDNDQESSNISEGDQVDCSMQNTDQERLDSPESLTDFLRCHQDKLLSGLLEELDTKINWNNDETEKDELDMIEEDTSEYDFSGFGEDTPIQPGHHLSMKISVLLIWIYVVTYSLTSGQLCDLLSLLNLHLIISNPAFHSVYRFKKFFTGLQTPMQKHYYCSYCFTSVECDQILCSNAACCKDLTVKNGTGYFIELKLKEQLSTLFSRKDFREGLTHRFSRNKQHQNNIEDVYDSQQYKLLTENNGPLNNKNNVTFTMNTDGIPVFNSSKNSIWPIYLMVNELPYSMRKARENMLLCGLWFGPSKPVMNMFCSPMQKALLEFEKGVNIQTTEGESLLVKAFLYCISCDTPARASVINMNQHMGECCCPKCMQPGSNYRTTKGGNIRTFPYIQDDPTGPARSADGVKHDAEKVTEQNKAAHVNGIQGPSVLLACPKVDAVKTIAVDYMHLICLGIVRLLLKLWFGVSHHMEEFSIHKFVEVVDARLLAVKPSHLITRKPRSIIEHLKFWKAAELRSWFFYYSLPCVMDLLPPLYLYHYAALVEGIYLLCQSSISYTDIEKSETLLRYFVFMMPSLYDARYMTINVHSLLHLPRTVLEIGPLWSTSCFPFESANGELLQLFHGTRYVDVQIANAVHVFQMLPILSQSVTSKLVAYNYVQKLMKTSTFAEKERFMFCGKSFDKQLTNKCLLQVIKHHNGMMGSLLFYKRASIRGIVYHSKEYTRVTKTNSYTVKYADEKGQICFGFILWFGCYSAQNSSQIACIEKLLPKHVEIFNMHHDGKSDGQISSNFLKINLPFLHFLHPVADQISIVPLKSIIDLCICVAFNSDSFVICEEPNHHEGNL